MSSVPKDSLGTGDEKIAKKLDDELGENVNATFIVDPEENMKVFLRVRPLLKDESNQGFTECVFVADDKTVHTLVPESSSKYKNSHYRPTEIFSFNQAFGPLESQYIFFENTMRDIIMSFLDGSNSLVFAYGSSGSGKTYTMQGISAHPGVLPLSVQLIFELIKKDISPKPLLKVDKVFDIRELNGSEIETELRIKEELLKLAALEENDSLRSDKLSMTNVFSEDLSQLSEYADVSSILSMKNLGEMSLNQQNNSSYIVWVSFAEIYNECVYDLLQPLTQKKRQRLALREDKQGNIYVKGLREVAVNNTDEVLKLLQIGRRNLNIASTKLNYQSSRSHCIFNIKLVRVSTVENSQTVKVNVISFCDLAGSERCDKTNNTGLRLKEAGNINTSLLVLGKCIEALRQNQNQKEKRIVPFRESKLTRLFSGFFTGKGKASMVVNISPSSYTFDESLGTLKFSAIAREVAMIESTTMRRLSDNFMNTKSRLSIGRGDGSCADTEVFDEDIDEQQAADDLCKFALNLENENIFLKAERQNFEENLRAELQEYYEMLLNRKDQRYKRLHDHFNAQADKRIKAWVEKIAQKDYSDEDESDDEVDGEDENEVEMDGVDEKKKSPKSVSHSEAQTDVVVDRKVSETEAQLKKMLQEKNDKIEKLTSHVCELKEHVEYLMKQLQEQKELMEKSADVLLEKENTISKQAQQIENLQKTISLQEKDLVTEQASIKKYSSEMQVKNMEINTMELEIKEFQKNVSAQENLLQAARKEKEKLSLEVSQKNELLKETKSKVDELEELLKEKESQLENAVSEQKKLSSGTSEKDAVLEKIEGKLQHVEDALKAKISEAEKAVKELNQMSSTHSQLNLELDNMRAEVGKLESALKDKDSELQDVVKQREQLSSDVAEKTKALDEINVKMKGFALEGKKELEKSIEEHNAQMNKKDEAILSLRKQVDNLQKVLYTSETALDDTKNKLSSNEQQFKAALDKLKDLEKKGTQLETLKRVLEEKNAKLNKYDDTVSDLKKQMEVMKNTSKNSETSLEEIRNSLASSNTNFNNALDKVQELEKSLLQKEKELANAIAHNKGSNEVSSNLEKQISDLKAIVTKKDEELSKLEKELGVINQQKTEENKKFAEIIKSKDEEIQALSQESEKVADEMVAMRKTLDDMDSTNQNNSEETTKFTDAIRARDQQIQSLEQDRRIMHERFSEDMARFENAVDEKEQQMNSIQQESERLVEEMCVLKKTLEESMKLDAMSKTQVAELRKLIEIKDRQIKEKESRAEMSRKSETSEMQKIIESKDVEIQNIKNDSQLKLENLQGKIDELEQTVTTKLATIKNLEADHKANVSKFQQEINDLTSTLSSKESLLETETTANEKTVNHLTKEMEKLKSKLADAESVVTTNNANEKKTVNRLTNEIEKLKSKLADTENVVALNNANEKTVNHLTGEVENLKSKLADAENAVTTTNANEKTVNRLTSEIEKLKSKLADAENAVTATNAKSEESKELIATSVETDVSVESMKKELNDAHLKIQNMEKKQMELKRMLGERSESINDLETDLQSPQKRKNADKENATVVESLKVAGSSLSKVARGRLGKIAAAASPLVQAVVEKVATSTPPPTKRLRVGVKAADKPTKPVDTIKKSLLPTRITPVTTPIVKKLRSRAPVATATTAIVKTVVAPAENIIKQVDQVDSGNNEKVTDASVVIDDSSFVDPPKRRKVTGAVQSAAAAKTKVDPPKMRTSRQRGASTASQTTNTVASVTVRKNAAKKTTKSIPVEEGQSSTASSRNTSSNKGAKASSALTYLSPKTTSTPKPTAGRRGRRFYGAHAQPMMISPINTVSLKSPATAEKSAKEIVRQINKRKLRR